MLNKNEAFAATKAVQLKVIEDEIIRATNGGEFETEVLNLTDEEQSILKEAGYKITNTATKQGFVWRINWE